MRDTTMTWTVRLMTVGLAAQLGATGCTEQEQRQAAALEAAQQPIIGGELERGFPAVGALVSDGEQFCTGTLVRPDIVVTAAHCLIEDPDNAAAISFFIGPDARRLEAGQRVTAASLHIHPDYDDFELVNDIAVMRLERPITDVTPIPLRTEPMTQDMIGQEALFVGYGYSDIRDEDAWGEKRSVRIPLTEIDDTVFTYAARGVNTCSGDSGGPALLERGGAVTLIGVTSYGDEDCVEFGANTRVDAFTDYIQQVIDGDAPPNPDGTGTGDGGDFCEEEGWYGDGVCDEDCARPDPDCDGTGDPGDGGDFCEEEGWYGEGVCDEDCARRDPDCDDVAGGDDGDDGGDICEEEGLYRDGICDEDCARPDPDCDGAGDGQADDDGNWNDDPTGPGSEFVGAGCSVSPGHSGAGGVSILLLMMMMVWGFRRRA